MQTSKDTLGDRMKMYESVPKTRLERRQPVLIRLDGKAFHTFTRSFERPWDERLHRAMWDAAKALCAQMAGAKVAYIQSDEITVLLTDYDREDTQPWFDYEVQKLCSVSAAICTGAFMVSLMQEDHFAEQILTCNWHPPAFDSRCWNVSREEVTNAFIWRQMDAMRNSLAMVCQTHFSPKQLHGKPRAEQLEMLSAIGVDWHSLHPMQRHGVCVVRETFQAPNPMGGDPVMRSRWVVDTGIPVFTQDRLYIERFVNPDQAV